MTDNHSASFSQAGEDRIVCFLLRPDSLGRPIRYLDLGAAYPMGDNNTYLFYSQFGASGVLVEADPFYAAQYALHRPRDVAISAAVLPSSMAHLTHVDFLKSADPGRSTVLPSQAEIARILGKGNIQETLSVPAIQLTSILAEYFPEESPDLVSIDVEGLDHDLLKDMDFTRWRPKAVVVENDGGNRVHDAYMASRQYILFGFTHVNSIYADREFLKSVAF
jgi:FkbM family methyltransferase